MDGGFHYLDNKLGDLNREHDKEKDRLAKENNVIMIRIDCQESEKNYIRHNIENSLLSKVFDLSKINWDLCDEKATKNLAKEVCLYYEKHYKEYTKEEIAEHFHISMTPMQGYIKKGLKFGWCTNHPAIHKASRRLNPNLEKEVCAYYEEHKDMTKQDVAHHFNMAYRLFAICFKDGIKNGWCSDRGPVGNWIKNDDEAMKKVCLFYEENHDKMTQKEIFKKFGISQPTFKFCLEKGYKMGWCNKHPRFHKK